MAQPLNDRERKLFNQIADVEVTLARLAAHESTHSIAGGSPDDLRVVLRGLVKQLSDARVKYREE